METRSPLPLTLIRSHCDHHCNSFYKKIHKTTIAMKKLAGAGLFMATILIHIFFKPQPNAYLPPILFPPPTIWLSFQVRSTPAFPSVRQSLLHSRHRYPAVPSPFAGLLLPARNPVPSPHWYYWNTRAQFRIQHDWLHCLPVWNQGSPAECHGKGACCWWNFLNWAERSARQRNVPSAHTSMFLPIRRDSFDSHHRPGNQSTTGERGNLRKDFVSSHSLHRKRLSESSLFCPSASSLFQFLHFVFTRYSPKVKCEPDLSTNGRRKQRKVADLSGHRTLSEYFSSLKHWNFHSCPS